MKRNLFLLLLVIAAVLALTACGLDDMPPQPATDPASVGGLEPSVETQAPTGPSAEPPEAPTSPTETEPEAATSPTETEPEAATAYGKGTYYIDSVSEDGSVIDSFKFVDGEMIYHDYSDLQYGKGRYGEGGSDELEWSEYYGMTVEQIVNTLENMGCTVTVTPG